MRKFIVLAAVLIVIGSRPHAQTAPAGDLRVVGTMSELMIRVIYPASDAVFYIATRTPRTDSEWGMLQGQALMLAESANLLMMPGHARDQERWMADARLLREAGAAAFKAAKAKDAQALESLNEQLYESCTTCHADYRARYRRPAR